MTKDLTPKDLIISDFDTLFPHLDDESYILVGCRSTDYSASLIARAVEDCNAQVLNLNVTALPGNNNDLVVSVRINHRDPSLVVRSLDRYGFDVIDAAPGRVGDADTMRLRANELLRYLEL